MDCWKDYYNNVSLAPQASVILVLLLVSVTSADISQVGPRPILKPRELSSIVGLPLNGTSTTALDPARCIIELRCPFRKCLKRLLRRSKGQFQRAVRLLHKRPVIKWRYWADHTRTWEQIAVSRGYRLSFRRTNNTAIRLPMRFRCDAIVNGHDVINSCLSLQAKAKARRAASSCNSLAHAMEVQSPTTSSSGQAVTSS